LDVSLATFYFFNKENAGAHRPGVHLPLLEGAETVQEAAAGAQRLRRVPRLRSRRLRRLRRRLLFLSCVS